MIFFSHRLYNEEAPSGKFNAIIRTFTPSKRRGGKAVHRGIPPVHT
jgi:hypothetical protein